MSASTFDLDSVEFAQSLQLQLMETTNPEHRLDLAVGALRLLEGEASQYGLDDAKFLVDTNYAVDRPVQERPPTSTSLIIFGRVAVEGRFRAFSYVQIGSILSNRPSVSSLCLSLDDVSMLPDGDLLPEGDVLHIPVLAITQKLRAA